MRSNRIWAFKLVAWLMAIFLFLVLIVLPLLTAVLLNSGQLPSGFIRYLHVVEHVQTIAMRFFTVVWIFFVGGCFASFLNVVAWRVPRGRSILGSSHCPFCNVKLTFRDNLPVVGWLRNAGRCSTCKLPIPVRYLVAEVILGSLFLVLAIVQLAGGGLNLPFRPLNSMNGFEHLLFSPQWDLIELLLYYLVLVSSLFTFALIESDRLPVPQKIFWFSVTLGTILPLIWPQMILVSWSTQYVATMSVAAMLHMLTLFLGAIAGMGLGCLMAVDFRLAGFSPSTSEPGSHESESQTTDSNQLTVRWDLVKGMTLTGIFLGWQAAFSICVFYFFVTLSFEVLLSAPPRNNQRKSIPFKQNDSAKLLLATMLHLLSWRLQASIPFWIGNQNSLQVVALGILAVFALKIAESRFSGKKFRDCAKSGNGSFGEQG